MNLWRIPQLGQYPEELVDALDKELSYIPPRSKLAISFSIEDIYLLYRIFKHGYEIDCFAIDTHQLPKETYAYKDLIEEKYEVPITWIKGKNPPFDQTIFKKELARKHCCHERKTLPLNEYLSGEMSWVTGQRQSQSVTRTNLPERRISQGKIQYNPLAKWSEQNIWDAARRDEVPHHPLYDKGYASIGCSPCTRAIKDDEPIRAGRWWWLTEEKKECGLHVNKSFD